MRRRYWILLLVLVAVIVVVIALAAVFNMSSIQLGMFRQVAASIEETTGWKTTAEAVELDLWPARVVVEKMAVDAGAGEVLRVGRIEARWSWSDLLNSPNRLESLVISGPVIEPGNLPPPSSEPTTTVQAPSIEEQLSAFELGSLVVTGVKASGSAQELEWTVNDLSIEAHLEAAHFAVTLEMARAHLVRQGRSLDLGPLSVAIDGDARGLRLTRAQLTGTGVDLDLTASVDLPDGALEIGISSIEVEPALLIQWFDPTLEDQVRVAGRLRMQGEIRRSAEGRLDYTLAHVGDPLIVGGIDVERLALSGADLDAHFELAGSQWGTLDARSRAGEVVDLAVTFDRTRLDSLTGMQGAPAVPEYLPPDIDLSGSLRAQVSLPFALDQLQIESDLAARWPDGRVLVVAAGDSGSVDIEKLEIDVPGAEIRASGLLSLVQLALELKLDVQRPDLAHGFIARWLPQVKDFALGGGPLAGQATIRGSMIQPIFEIDAEWLEPQAEGFAIDHLVVHASGDSRAADWQVDVDLGSAGMVTTTGRTDFRTLLTEGHYELVESRLEGLVELARIAQLEPLIGAAECSGDFAVSTDSWRATSHVQLGGLEVEPWRVDRAVFDVTIDPEAIVVDRLEMQTTEAFITGQGRYGLIDDNAISGELEVHGLELWALPIELPPVVFGAVNTELQVSGTLTQPEAELSLQWIGIESTGPLQVLRLRAILEDGVVGLVSEQLSTAAGELALTGSLPLGGVTRPEWLWPSAPTGPLAVDIIGSALSSAPLMAAMAVEDAPIRVTGSLDGRVRWDLTDEDRRLIELELGELVMDSELEHLEAEDVVRIGVRGSRVVVEPVTLRGSSSRLGFGGSYELELGELEVHANGTLDSSIVKLLPIPLEVEKAVEIQIDLAGPPEALAGRVRFDHTGGTILMRDPIVELKDLVLDLSLNDGVMSIDDGRAGLNRGTVVVGGGWDPEVGQGVVLELEDVAFLLPMEILSRWDGILAIEPDPDGLFLVAGDLVLDGGFWDQPFDYASVFFGGSDAGLASDDPFYGINLDLQIDGRRGLEVNNNLGTFEVEWKRLHIGGSAALPVLEGELKIPQGGVVKLAGRSIEVRRGSVEFVGDPFAPPRVEIVAEGAIAAFGSESEGESIDTAAIATKALAKSLGSALGLENETLQPAEIAVATETDPSQRFAVGQRLSRNLALILTTDLSDVQDRQTLLQLWNLPLLPGLAIQVFDETATDSQGVGVIERLAWGGTRVDDDRPRIHRVKLEGDWPLWKWQLHRKTGLSKGRPYDPFLLFAGEVRLQRVLAEAGFYQARVGSRAEGSEKLPALVFSCEAGDRVEVTFEGDRLPRKLRRQVTGLYRAPPLQQASIDNMVLTIERYLLGKGHPDSVVTVTQDQKMIVVTVESGPERRFSGPRIEGLPISVASVLAQILSAPTELAALADDEERAHRSVKHHLRSHGYHHVEGVELALEPADDGGEQVVLDIHPGPRAVIDEIRIDGTDPLATLVDHGAVFTPGEPLDRWAMDRALLAIRGFYRAKGYIDASVGAKVSEIGDDIWAVSLEIDPGAKRTVAAVEITGLRHIRETVLEGGVSLVEGEVFSFQDMDNSASNLANFAPVERVHVNQQPAGVDQTKVTFEITEKDRWLVGAGVRYRSDRGFEVVTDLSDRNLFGRGYGLNLQSRWDQDSMWGRLLFAFSQRPGKKSSWSMSLAYEEFDRLDDGGRSTGIREEISRVGVEQSYELAWRTDLRPYLRLKRAHVFEIEPDFFFPLDETIDIATLGGQLVRDRLDDPFDPRSGYYIAVDLSGSREVSEGGYRNLRTLLTGSLVLEPRSNWAWSQSMRLGVSDPLGGTLVSDDRFFAGGQASVRGFTTDFVGPVEYLNGVPFAVGGGALFILNEELRIPIWQELRLALFADIGQVWESWSEANGKLSVGAGFGFRYATPIGPVWGDVAWPVANKGLSTGAKYYVGIGRTF